MVKRLGPPARNHFYSTAATAITAITAAPGSASAVACRILVQGWPGHADVPRRAQGRCFAADPGGLASPTAKLGDTLCNLDDGRDGHMNPIGVAREAADRENWNDGDAAAVAGPMDDHDHDHGHGHDHDRSALAGVRVDRADPRGLACSPLQVVAGSSQARDHARECAAVVANDVVRAKELRAGEGQARAARASPTGLEVAAMTERATEQGSTHVTSDFRSVSAPTRASERAMTRTDTVWSMQIGICRARVGHTGWSFAVHWVALQSHSIVAARKPLGRKSVPVQVLEQVQRTWAKGEARRPARPPSHPTRCPRRRYP
jgi:hypothetical protein